MSSTYRVGCRLALLLLLLPLGPLRLDDGHLLLDATLGLGLHVLGQQHPSTMHRHRLDSKTSSRRAGKEGGVSDIGVQEGW